MDIEFESIDMHGMECLRRQPMTRTVDTVWLRLVTRSMERSCAGHCIRLHSSGDAVPDRLAVVLGLLFVVLTSLAV